MGIVKSHETLAIRRMQSEAVLDPMRPFGCDRDTSYIHLDPITLVVLKFNVAIQT